jgi:mannose-1-phosphate guanylyltransferase/mannose-1-phosphate guanylyltransferase/mannose-6-phosphate isomerase
MTRRPITPVILSGGAGSRLWPLSTTATPKQFLALTGELTMLQLTAQRAVDRARFKPPVVIAAEAHGETVERQLAAIGIAPLRSILEPCGRGTAPAAALCALTAEPGELLLLMPSDHLIQAPERLSSAIEAAIPVVERGWLATFGVAAAYPETGYGYISRGEEIAPGVRRVERFVEKPDARAAAQMVAQGGFDWNAGIFLFAAGAFLDALRRHAPDILACAEAALVGSSPSDPHLRPDAGAFGRCRNESIDRAVMEKAERVAVVPVEMGWSDIGSWDALHAVSAKDADGNALSGPATAPGSRSCLVRSEGPRVVAIGVEDLIVVATRDAVLVVPRGQSQRVKEAVERLSRPRQTAGAD